MKKILRKHQYFSIIISSFIVLLLLFGTFLNLAHAQESLSGWFNIIWGDSKDGKSSMIYTLTDEEGKRTLLQLDETVVKELGGVLKFNRKYVSVQGTFGSTSSISTTSGSTLSPPAVFNVISISLAPLPESKAPIIYDLTAAAVSGSHPWVTIMCQFSDQAAQPNDRAYFLGMYADTHPGLNHYWKELSFNTADVTGSTVVGTGWYTINTVATYNSGLCSDCTGEAGRTALFNDCVAAADADVDFSLYSGVNLMFNFDFDFGWAWGGSRTATLDGVTRSWAVTWEPPWSYADISVISHEMGHGFGLPHSTFPEPTNWVYDNPWDVMSQDRYNCAAATDPTYGCIAQHTISYFKDMLGWIPGPRKTSVAVGASATVTLEDLAAPASANYQMVSIPIGGSATNLYTVEARRFTGYDFKLPDEGVVIHEVDPGSLTELVPDAGDREDPWNVGETFIDATNSIAVCVNADTGTGFAVTISNGNLPPTSDADGPYMEECNGSTTDVALDGSGSSDPEGSILTYSWSTTCDGTFDDSTYAQPTLTVNTSNVCNYNCGVSLTVTDDESLSCHSDSATVTIVDTTSPTLVNVPSNVTVECDAVPLPAEVTATDNCDTSVTPSFLETRVDGSCPSNYTLTRTWTAVDGCGNSSSASQTITVQDTTPPVISSNAPSTIIPPDAPISFVASAIDNCDDDPYVEITGYDCFFTTNKGKIIDKKESCVVSIAGDTITIVDSGGVNGHITWDVSTTDNCGNVAQDTFEITVLNPAQ